MKTNKVARLLILVLILLSCSITPPGIATQVIPTQEKQAPEQSASPAAMASPTATIVQNAPVIPSATAAEAPTAASTVETSPRAPSYIKLQIYQGDGFSLRYPANARVEAVAPASGALSEVHISGPDISIKPGDADWTVESPGYQLIVQTYDNPSGLDAETWTREDLLKSWREAQGGPYLGPVLESGKIDEERVGQTSVAGYPAFWVSFFGGDSSNQVFYLSNKTRIFALSFREYPVGNQPIALVQQDAVALLMSTFRFAD